MNNLGLQLYKKYAPSPSKLLFRAGLVLLICLVGGIGYGLYFMDVSGSLDAEDEFKFRLGIGTMNGLYLCIVPWLILMGTYCINILKAKKKAERELFRIHQNKLNK